ncbi:hypothetical protein WJ542_26550 [Paraburkholderia sp. B3]|uniref:hypothetical protein n=1 Tax=Paraburkholderia sp. B3 TaxID=3134791 RepID=UPI003981E59D
MAVGKWLGATRKQTVRVIAVHRSRSGRIVSVCVEMQGASRSCGLFFFHHPERGWQVFPPEGTRPAMSVARHAA